MYPVSFRPFSIHTNEYSSSLENYLGECLKLYSSHFFDFPIDKCFSFFWGSSNQNLQTKSIHQIDSSGYSLMMHAAASGDIEKMSCLKELGALIDNSNKKNKYRPLTLAVFSSQFEAVKLLSEWGADIEKKETDKHSPLQYAVHIESSEIAQYFINQGVSINSIEEPNLLSDVQKLLVSSKNEPPHLKNPAPPKSITDNLLEVAKASYYFVAHLLLKTNFYDLKDYSHNRRTPFFDALIEENTKAIRLLTFLGANINQRDSEGESPLTWAVKNQKEEMIQILCELQADTEIFDVDGRTPLLMAVEAQDLKAMEILYSFGANIEAEDDYGITPLIAAILPGHLEAMLLLLKWGADIEHRDYANYSPLIRAENSGQHKMKEILIKRGASEKGIEVGRQGGWTFTLLPFNRKKDSLKEIESLLIEP